MTDHASVLAVVFGVFLGVVHFFSERIRSPRGRTRYRIVSLAAGVSIAYLFLHLLPETYEAAVHLRQWVFIFLLLGFSAFHLVEKLIYQHADRAKLAWELKEVHSIAFFAYHFIVGVALEDKIRAGVLDGVLFLVPITLHAYLSTASLSGIHGEIRERLATKVVLCLATLLGVIFAMLFRVPVMVGNILVSLIAGVLLYIIVREFLPEKERGEPAFFVIGLGAFVAVSLLLTGGHA
jgi:zinc transporter ZupT